MGKKNKDQEPIANLNGVANRDIIQRINFLYQASTYLNTISQTLTSTSADTNIQTTLQPSKGRSKKKQKLRHPKDAAELSRSYVGTMRTVGQKTMVRMDPSMKRTLCKTCDTVLLPGSTVTVRIRPSLQPNGQSVVHTCLTCQTLRRIPAPPVFDRDASQTQYTAPTKEVDRAASTSTTALSMPSVEDGIQTMVIDHKPTLLELFSSPKGKRKRKRKVARAPPLFERKGHIIFRGNERLSEEEAPT
ncbi:Rpr2-domain-containing protein [Trametes gibbosa]|nr:Rpr2-domain-containing protein [Trametes gibbosa]